MDGGPDYAAGPVHPLHAVDDGICFGSLNSHGRGKCRDGKSAKLEKAHVLRAHLRTSLRLNSLAGCVERVGSATGDWALLGCLNCPIAGHSISTTSTTHRPAFTRSMGAKEPKLVRAVIPSASPIAGRSRLQLALPKGPTADPRAAKRLHSWPVMVDGANPFCESNAHRRRDGRRSELVQDANQLSVRGRTPIANRLDRVRLGQPVEAG